MNLNGKKINFLGDSITEGVGTTTPDKRFVDIMIRDCGLAEGRNYGISGTRFARQKSVSFPAAFDVDFSLRIPLLNADTDIVIIFGGTNDFGHGDALLGEYGDKTVYTFYGACDTLFCGVKEKFPDALIVVVAPLHRDGEESTHGDCGKETGYPLSDYVDAELKVAKAYGYPVLDCFYGEKAALFTADKFADGLHLNDDGNALMARVLKEFLESL